MSRSGESVRASRALEIVAKSGPLMAAFLLAASLHAQTFHVISTLPSEWFSSQLTMDRQVTYTE